MSIEIKMPLTEEDFKDMIKIIQEAKPRTEADYWRGFYDNCSPYMVDKIDEAIEDYFNASK